MALGVVHLVRKLYGLEPYRVFIESLRRAPPPGDWQLVLLLKGVAEGEGGDYLAEAAGLPVLPIYMPDVGFDISAYFTAAERTDCDPLVFLNSFSKIVEPRWAELYLRALAVPDVGLVGATGSLESFVRNHIEYARAAHGAAKAKLYAIATGLRVLFPPFPNAHVRTNAFMIRREHFLSMKRVRVERKLAAWMFENGWFSLTRQITARGLRAVIVDRDGAILEPAAWADARVFRSGDQAKVVVEDNRVREYADATAERKAMLRWLAFGQRV